MRRSYHVIGLATVFLLLVPPTLAADKKDKDADPKDKAAEKLITAGQVSGVLKSDGGSQKYITITVPLQIVQPNVQALAQQQQQLLQYQQQIMRAPPWQRQQLAAQYMAQMRGGSPYTVRQINHDLDFQAADDMIVRTAFVPVQFDEKGNVKRYTQKELRELRGDGNLPGYTAEMDALKPGQVVTLYLAKPKAKPKEKAKDKDGLDDDKPAIKMIVIVQDVKDS